MVKNFAFVFVALSDDFGRIVHSVGQNDVMFEVIES